jgi:hypothetical protein
MERHNYRHLSTGEPTYWQTDRKNFPTWWTSASPKASLPITYSQTPVSNSLRATLRSSSHYHWKPPSVRPTPVLSTRKPTGRLFGKKIKHISSSSSSLRTAQGTWARTNIAKAHAFANNIASLFQPHPSTNLPDVRTPPPIFGNSLPTRIPTPPIQTNRNSNSHQQHPSQNFPWLRPHHG